jgi:hypothetical protein
MSVVAAATLFFLLLHAAVALRTRGAAFHVQLKLSRGLASVILAGIGFYGLSQWWPLWPQAFLVRHAPGSDAWLLVAFVTGHFVADVLLLGWGLWRRDSSPRKDLLAHHALGIFACSVVFYYGIGHAFFVIALTTEMMPVTSGIAALAPLLHRPGLERRATQLRLAVLVLWRLPLWAVLAALVSWRVAQGEADSLIALGQRIALASLAVVVLLDSYWIRLCLLNLREGRTAA